MQSSSKKLTPQQAWEKMKHWCAWQERCHADVFSKLREAGLSAVEADTLVAKLIEEDYLNEERFARQFAGGHFRLKKWGRQKIVFALRQKKVSEYCIKVAMAEIGEEDYSATLQKLAAAKWKATAGGTPAQRWSKTRMYLLQKGYDSADVLQVLQQLQSR